MSLSAVKKTKLKSMIDRCTEFEGRYYLVHLYEDLTNSKRPSKKLDPIADALIVLIEKIELLKDPKSNKAQTIKEISTIYHTLVKQSGATGVFYHSKQILLALGGTILGVINAALGGLIGFAAGAINDLRKFEFPTGSVPGALAGSLVGSLIGYRMLDTALQNKEQKVIRQSVKSLATTFESLFDEVGFQSLEEIVKKEVLTESFQNDEEAFNLFLKQDRTYHLLSIKASFVSNKLKGSVGHHTFIKFNINDTDKPKLVELGVGSSANETEFSQAIQRTTTGSQLIKMLTMHRLLQQKMKFWGFFPTYLLRYSPMVYDCHTYVNLVLQSVGEQCSPIQRFDKEQDNFFGRFIGRSLQFFSPESKKEVAKQTNNENNPIVPQML